jgi:hypothetical protein
MFEESRSFEAQNRADPAKGQGSVYGLPPRRGEVALKAIAWSELTARLNAARELRLALRHDARRNIEDAAASFSDAAAKYFRALEGSQQLVNLAALDDHKGSTPILPGHRSNSGCGDYAQTLLARDDARDEQ